MISGDDLPVHWSVTTLGELGRFRNGKCLAKKDMDGGSYPVYGSNGQIGSHSEYWLEEPCLAVGRVGSCGSVTTVYEDSWVSDNAIVFWPDSVILKYVAYYLQLFDFSPLISQAAQPLIRQGDVKEIEIPLPPLSEQERIVSVLDDAFESLDRVSELSQQIRDRGDELIGAISYRQFGTDDLPDEWEICELSKAVEYKSNLTTPKDTPDREFTLLDLEDVEPHTGRITGTKTVAGSEIGSSKRDFGSDDILYCKLRPYLNKVVCPDFEGVASSELLALEPKEGFLKEYVAYFLRSPAVWQRAESLMKGANHPRINKGDLLSFAIPKPPLEEQERIVALLDGLTGVTGRSISSATQIADYAGELRGSLLQQAFTGQLLRD